MKKNDEIVCHPNGLQICFLSTVTFTLAQDEEIFNDLLWSDPADDDSKCVDPRSGFGENVARGAGVVFGNKAVDAFSARMNVGVILRGHQQCAHGVKVAKAARVLTIHSATDTSNFRYTGCAFVNRDGLVSVLVGPNQPSVPQTLQKRLSWV